MRKSKSFFSVSLLMLFFFVMIFHFATEAANKKIPLTRPLIWNVNELELIKKDTTNSKTYHNIIKVANMYCSQSPIVVTNKTKTYAPNSHYYCSIGPYWWPDPSNPQGKYINKDCEINPEYYEYDAKVIEELVDRCVNLGKAYFFTEDIKYYKAFIRQLRAWFIDRKTYMYPNFEYAQVVPGDNNNKGRSNGSIEAYEFHYLMESVRLVNMIKPIDKRTLKKIRNWFVEFADWMEDVYGNTMQNFQNNVTLAYDVTRADMYLFAGYEEHSKEIIDNFAETRIYTQIKENGEQPAELKRASAIVYSIYNLNHVLDLCYLSKYWYPDYYQQHSERIEAAIIFLEESIEHPEGFQYNQKSGFDKCRSSIKTLIKRRDMLVEATNPTMF